MSKRLLLLILSLTLVSGCGFKLRADFELPSVLSRIAIVGGNRSLNEQFREQLREKRQQSSTALTETDSGGATLFISKSEFQSTVRSVDKNGLATSHDYIYTIEYNVTDDNGAVVQPLATLSQHRTLDYQPEQALAIAAEEEFLKQEMEQEIVLQLLRRLSRIPEYSKGAQ